MQTGVGASFRADFSTPDPPRRPAYVRAGNGVHAHAYARFSAYESEGKKPRTPGELASKGRQPFLAFS